MSDDQHAPRTATANRDIAAPAAQIFELIADPAQQPIVGPGGVLDRPVPGAVVTQTPVRD